MFVFCFIIFHTIYTPYRKPAFIIPLGEDEITLFRPLGMSCVEYRKALVRFDEFLSINGKRSFHPNMNPKMISIGFNANTTHNGNSYDNRNEYEKKNENEISFGGLLDGVRYGCSGQLHVKGEENENELTIYPGCNPFDLYTEYSSLNQGQKDAVKKVLFARDYALLLGLPGTGKTSTLSLIVRAIISRGERVVICSYTHAAVDNLLMKIVEAGMTSSFVVRIGYETSVNPDLKR